MKLEPITIFTALDLEMNQPSGKIIQIGAVVGNIATGEVLDRLSIFVNPNEELSPYIIDLCKIKQCDVDNGISLKEAYLQLRDFHLKHKSFINPITWGGGDNNEIKEQLSLVDDPDRPKDYWCFGRRWIDAKTIFVSWRMANQEPIQGGLARSLVKVGLKFEGQKHNALHDAENTFKMYLKMLSLLKGQKCKN